MNMEGLNKMRKIGVVTKYLQDFQRFAKENNLELCHDCAYEKNHDIKYYLVSSIEKSRGCEFHEIIIYKSGNEFSHLEIEQFKTRVRL
jgi:hypothetical protein